MKIYWQTNEEVVTAAHTSMIAALDSTILKWYTYAFAPLEDILKRAVVRCALCVRLTSNCLLCPLHILDKQLSCHPFNSLSNTSLYNIACDALLALHCNQPNEIRQDIARVACKKLYEQLVEAKEQYIKERSK